MSFTFGTASSSGAAPNSATASAPASGNLFGAPATGTPSFSFGPASGASGANSTTPATTGNLFGQQKPAGNLFGATPSATPSATPKTSAGGMFGGGSTTTSTAGGGLFGGGAAATSAPGTGSLFGAASTAPATGGPFGNTGASNTPPGGLMFGAQNNANKTQGTTTTPSAPASAGMFGNTGNALFGNKTSTTTSNQGAAPTATPAKPLFSLASTTPAGAPPTDSSKPGLFGNTAGSQQTGGFLGGAATKPSSTTTASTSQPSTTATSGLGLFGGAGQGSAGGVFEAKSTTSAAPAAGGLFGTTATSTAQPTPSAPAAASASAGTTGALFGLKPAAPATGSAPTASMPAPAATGGLFGAKPAATTTTSSAAPATTATTGNMFGTATQSSAGSTAKPASLFGTAATTTTSQPATSSAATTTTSTTAPATAASGSMFGTKPASDNKEKDKDTAKPVTQNGAASMLGASTTGPPSQMARLKNKTMEDIVTRWASDLSKYQKEFKEQATIVSNWDRNLVDNGEKIQKLYLDTFEAERASHEIERQLSAVESQQEELEAWLNRYESEVQDMFAKQMGPGEQLGGPDQERERTYKLAEKLTQQLDEKSRDLSKMVKEINDISGTLSKGAKTEDPLSQIVRVLNGHLTQLQWIDVNASALQAKVTAAQKSSSNLGSHYAGGESDAAESFYRSYMGRR